jgi:hypothetical protein
MSVHAQFALALFSGRGLNPCRSGPHPAALLQRRARVCLEPAGQGSCVGGDLAGVLAGALSGVLITFSAAL